MASSVFIAWFKKGGSLGYSDRHDLPGSIMLFFHVYPPLFRMQKFAMHKSVQLVDDAVAIKLYFSKT